MSNAPKTQPTAKDPKEFIETVPDPLQRADSLKLLQMMQKVAGEKPVMWGPTMIGFGKFSYEYASGHKGDWFRIGFSPRKASLTLYLTVYGFGDYDDLLAKLGKYTTSKACLYIKRLSDVDLEVLEQLMRRAWKNNAKDLTNYRAKRKK